MEISIILNLVIGALMAGSIYGILGIGYSLIYKATGLMNLAQGDFLMFGAYIGLTFFANLRLPYYIAITLTFAVMFGLGWIVQLGLITPLLNKGAKYSYVILCTAAVSLILQNSIMFIWGVKVQYFPSIFSATSVNILGAKVMPESLLVLGIAIVSATALFFFMTRTRFGTAMRAAAQNQKAASAMGINVSLTKGITWGLAAGLAGIIGATIGPIYGVYMMLGALIGQKAFAGAVVGGYGNVYGAIVGGMFFGFLETFIAAYLTTTYKDLISFGVLIVALTFMPTGIFKEQVIE
jgi:branched-chain amino acid transport system permease protein